MLLENPEPGARQVNRVVLLVLGARRVNRGLVLRVLGAPWVNRVVALPVQGARRVNPVLLATEGRLVSRVM